MRRARLPAYDIADLRELAKRRLPRGLFEFIDRGTDGDVALRDNVDAFGRVRLVPRPLVDVSGRSTACTIVGKQHSMPLAVAPTGAAGLVWFRGEIELAKAAAAANVPFTMATRSMSSMEAVAEQAGGTLWLQLYPSRHLDQSRTLLQRAAACRFEALMVTVDTPTSPRRVYNERNGFSTSFKPTPKFIRDMLLHPRWLFGVMGRYRANGGFPRFENLPGRPSILDGIPTSEMLDGRLDWDMVRELRRLWQGRLIVKGVLRPEDAVKSLEIGADAIVVSNHGGRNLDPSPPPIEVLPRIAEAVAGRASVLVDGGVRRGIDIARALALGAEAVLVGRPTLYGAAAGGEAGAALALDILLREFDTAIAMLGCRGPTEIDADFIA